MKDTLQLRSGTLPACLEDVPENTYHAVLCDPPYGLGEIKDLAALLRAWLDGEDGEQGPGMLSRGWDIVVPPSAWREYLRVTRPGGLCFAYSHARTYHLQALAMQLAGWRILPMIVRIHGSAMALGQATGKAIDKAAGAEREIVGPHSNPASSFGTTYSEIGTEPMLTAPATPLAALFETHNTALKNNLEPIVCAVKPPEGTWAENAERWGCGAFNVQLGRVPSGPDHAAKCASVEGLNSPRGGVARGAMKGAREDSYNPAGRYPSNVQLLHLPDCGADWCAPGCAVRELGEMSGELGRSTGTNVGGHRGDRRVYGRSDEGVWREVGKGDAGTAARFFWQCRASTKERAAGCEHLLWRRAPEHPDDWELVDRETWDWLGDEAAAKARDTAGYLERMAEGYMRWQSIRRPNLSTEDTRPGGSFKHRPGGERRQVLDVDRLDAAAYLDAARARVRTTGSPHLAVKPLDGGAYLAKLLLQPVVDGEGPRLLVPYAGTGSETIGAMLAGWTRVDAWESSAEWNEVHEARFKFWAEIVEKGGAGKALEMLQTWGTTPGEDPEAGPGLEQLSIIFDVDGAMPGADLDDDETQATAARLYDEVGAILGKPADASRSTTTGL